MGVVADPFATDAVSFGLRSSRVVFAAAAVIGWNHVSTLINFMSFNYIILLLLWVSDDFVILRNDCFD